MTMATIDASIVIVAMLVIFRGISLDPLTPGNVSFLLWMIMGYCSRSRARRHPGPGGDLDRGRVYNLGFVVFTLAVSRCPLTRSRARTACCG